MSDKEKFSRELHKRIKILNETLWGGNYRHGKVTEWLNNFYDEEEKMHALFLLSNFMYFSGPQIKQLLISAYRDMYKYPIIENIRKENNHTLDIQFIESQFEQIKGSTLFLGIGNVAESGNHLLYKFRQENKLPKNIFQDTEKPLYSEKNDEIISNYGDRRKLVYFDDFVGSGSQAIEYGRTNLAKIRKAFPQADISYILLFGTVKGIKAIKESGLFDKVDCVVEIDDSFKLFGLDSRYFKDPNRVINREFLFNMCKKHGKPLMRIIAERLGHENGGADYFAQTNSLGFGDCQLLIGFDHNVPDNTLPIVWFNEDESIWTPFFKRANKIYE
ncbi:hypothetical protein I6I98_13015 [Sphingobacterium multivorum]|uniref:PRTase-CE domain-containing protein n=1 Tax=Sphingobacterium multivorum TaxID=28454 RepID=A0ABX7CXD0_SPHMU|nr:hypothetical protein [Sphingobacterium multivorum]QQT56123.1 hypothetical protein I6I98_13015 [Sphingobacterium multivorum]